MLHLQIHGYSYRASFFLHAENPPKRFYLISREMLSVYIMEEEIGDQ